MIQTSLHIAMISAHSSPVGRLGTQDTGGMSVYIRELSRQLGLRGHRVDIFTRAGDGHAPGEETRISENVRLITLELGPTADAPKAALYPHLLGFFQGVENFRLRNAQDYDVIHSHYWLSGQVGRWARQAWGIPHITTFHTLAEVKNRLSGKGSEPDVRLAVERELAAACDLVLVTSAREKANLLRYYPAKEEAIAVVPCGVDLVLFRPLDKALARRRIGASTGETIALFVGRFAPEKGLERLLRASVRLVGYPQLRVIVVGGDGNGDAAYRRALELSRSYGLAGRVTFVGRVDHEDLPFFYNAADVLVLPSLYESFGMVALEALACGTPVVATRVGAMEEILRDGMNGRLTRDQRPSSLAAALSDIFRQKDRPESAVEAIRRSVWRYSWLRVADGVLSVYHAALSAAAAAAGGVHAEIAVSRSPERSKITSCGCAAASAI